jgi:pimeloyl-ACP methyl ester carboxylesterase
MKTIHRWFSSGDYSLLGHFDCPETQGAQLGALIVPPFGWEDVCSYRPLRCLGRTLAENGIPALRFDLPGTGDSAGGSRDDGLLDAWIRSVNDAALELRRSTGVADVAVVGIRLGAMLAVSAMAQESTVQDLILWGARSNGRALLRELRAFGNMQDAEYASGVGSPTEAVPGLEIAGFFMTPETLRALEALDLSLLPVMQGKRALVLSCDDLPADAKLVRALEKSGCAVQSGTGSGYAAMMAVPHEAIAPTETAQLIVEFLTRDRPKNRNDRTTTMAATSFFAEHPTSVSASVIPIGGRHGTRVLESTYMIESSGGSMFGVLSEPEVKTRQADCCVLFLNAGAVRHVGPNRMWVETARRWAARGITCLRLDLQSIGESDGDQNLDTPALYQDELVEQVEVAMDSLRVRTGARKFAAIGLCSGAFWAFQAAVRRPEIRGAILLNQRLFFWDPEVDRRRLLRRTVKGLIDWSDWRRLMQGEVTAGMIKDIGRAAIDRLQQHRAGAPRRLQIPADAMADAWAALERSRSRVTFVFTEGEPLLREMEEEGQMPPETIPCIRIANSGHTFRPLWAQKIIHELIDRELSQIFGEYQPELAKNTLAGARSEVAPNVQF